jgi:multiple sugar transport system ATP-binding protein
MATVVLDHVSKRFSASAAAVDDISLAIGDGELLVLVGPSGCGKSTTLRLIAGLESCDSGAISIDGRRVESIAAKDRDLALVFQNYALYPHMTVYKNLSFGLEQRFGGGFGERVVRRIFRPGLAVELHRQRAGISRRVLQAAQRLGIEHLLTRRPHQLSGGERQRVALGRAIVRDPAAFLFDEPLSNLDARLRMEMRGEIKRLHRELSATMVYVTHDQLEAMTLGDRIAVMDRGRVIQVGTPQEIYGRPRHRFVAQFFGSHSVNFFAGKMQVDPAGTRFTSDDGSVALAVDVPPAPPGSAVVLGVRPEHVAVRPKGDRPFSTEEGWVGAGQATVGSHEWLGDASIAHLRAASRPAGLVARVPDSIPLTIGQPVSIGFHRRHLLWFDPTSGESLLKD